MSENSPSSTTRRQSSLPEKPNISSHEYARLPRVERIYHHIMWPRWYKLTETDSLQLERMKLAYNILIEAPTDIEAQALIKTVIVGATLSSSQVLELIWETKELFGRIRARNKEFDRDVVRMQLIDIARRAKQAGDIKQERLTWQQITVLDQLALKDQESGAPVVPQLPDVILTNKYSDEEPAQIESSPVDEEG